MDSIVNWINGFTTDFTSVVLAGMTLIGIGGLSYGIFKLIVKIKKGEQERMSWPSILALLLISGALFGGGIALINSIAGIGQDVVNDLIQ